MDSDNKVFTSVGGEFGEKLFTSASAKKADGYASTNLGAFDHAGENRDYHILSWILVYLMKQ